MNRGTRVTPLDGGTLVVTRDLPGRSSVALGLWFAVGGRHESAEQNGSAHFIEHMLFKGTRRRTARAISEAVEGLGGYLNAFTCEEQTCFYARARHDRLETLFDVLSDMVIDSRFTACDVAKEREVIKEEIAMYNDQPHQLVLEALNELIWPDQPLGRPLAGTPLTLDRLGRTDLLRFMRTHYSRGSLVVAAAGQVSHDQVLKLARRLVSRLPAGSRASASPAHSEQSTPRVHVVTKPAEQTQLALAFRGFCRTDPRRFACRLTSVVLGENMSSRLFQSIREQHGLAYSIGTSLASFYDTGAFLITAGLDNRNVRRALELVLRELIRMAARAPSGAELKRARDYVLGQFRLGLESTENQMNSLGEQMLGFGRIHSEAEIERGVLKVTAADVRAVARALFKPSNANLALVCSGRSSKELLGQIRTGLS